MEPLSEGKREGKKLERGTAGRGCWDGGEGILFNFILSPCLHQPCRLSSLIFTHRKRREDEKEQRVGGGSRGYLSSKGTEAEAF